MRHNYITKVHYGHFLPCLHLYTKFINKLYSHAGRGWKVCENMWIPYCQKTRAVDKENIFLGFASLKSNVFR